MSKASYTRFVAGVLLGCAAASGQSDIQLRARQLPGWDPRAREGRCEVRVWVDNRAEVRMRGDAIFVRTLEGSRGHDEGSQCTQPVPYNAVADFQVRQTAGRSKVNMAQQPSRANNFTALIEIEDRQGGGDNYAFEVTWRADTQAAVQQAPFFDDVRACQDVVRQRFLGQNGRGSYIDFESFAERQSEGRGQNSNPRRAQGRGRRVEVISGRGSARSRNESRDLTYSCNVDSRQGQIASGAYQYASNGLRTDERSRLR